MQQRDILNFNSTIVRLKEEIKNIFSEYRKDFNSTIVRLKAYSEDRLFTGIRHFNSTIVRLKGEYRVSESKFNVISILR